MTINDTTIFLCDPINICSSLESINKCQFYPDMTYPDRSGITACCCSDHYCNYPMKSNDPTTPIQTLSSSMASIASTRNITSSVAIATTTPMLPSTIINDSRMCYFGVGFSIPGSVQQNVGQMMSCNGLCTNTTIAGAVVVYACDPLSICSQYNLVNRCGDEGQNISGCCCDTADNCNFPGVVPPPPTSIHLGMHIILFITHHSI